MKQKSNSILFKYKIESLFLISLLLVLTGCPTQKSTIELERNSAKTRAIKTSIRLLKSIKEKEYSEIEKLHIGGTLKDFRLYISRENFKNEVDFISSMLEKYGIDEKHIELTDENSGNQISQLECIYHVFDNRDGHLSIMIDYIDLAGPDQVSSFIKDYKANPDLLDTTLSIDYVHTFDSLHHIKDSLDKIHK